MKLMTYNLLNGAKNTMDSVVQVANDQSPDILFLNEANGFDVNNNQILDEFAAATSFPYKHLARCGDGNDYHVAIFSKQPWSKLVEVKPLDRAGILVVVDSPFGEVAILGTHLTPYTEDMRLKEASTILAALEPYDQKIIMGDLNSLAGVDDYRDSMIGDFNDMQFKKFTSDGHLRYDVMRMFEHAGFIDAAQNAAKSRDITAPTMINEHGAHTNMRLDYILISSSIADRLTDYCVVKNELTNYASDHYPVVAELT